VLARWEQLMLQLLAAPSLELRRLLSSLSPGEWVSFSYVHPTALPSNWFFRADGL
jgi:hypothetical protein